MQAAARYLINMRLGVDIMPMLNDTELTEIYQRVNSLLTEHDRRVNSLFRKRDKAIEDLIAAWTKRQKAKNKDEDLEECAVEDLNRAADALVLAHVAMTFEVVG